MASLDFDSDGSSESEAEIEMTMRAVLPVADFNDYDPSVPPQTGADYLRRVQLEAKKEPKIKVATNIDTILNKSLLAQSSTNHQMEELSSDEFICSKADFRLSESAISHVIQLFVHIREEADKLKEKYANNTEELQRSKKWWKEFCLEAKEDQPINSNYELEHVYTTNLPRLSFLTQLDQSQICQLLKYHSEWIEEEYTIGNGLWIYSLLAALDTTQTGDVYNLLRQISRQCSRIRYRLENESDFSSNNNLELISSVNLIIYIIALYFGQKDLIDH